jgi:hypothetical protein
MVTPSNPSLTSTILTRVAPYLLIDQVTLKEDASPEEVKAAKQHAKDQGGEITHEYNLIKGFA